jgi:hypothetical protein
VQLKVTKEYLSPTPGWLIVRLRKTIKEQGRRPTSPLPLFFAGWEGLPGLAC